MTYIIKYTFERMRGQDHRKIKMYYVYDTESKTAVTGTTPSKDDCEKLIKEWNKYDDRTN